LRAGVVKARLLFSTPAIRPLELEDPDSPDFRSALHTIAHECAHVEDLKHRDNCFPGRILQTKITHADDAAFHQVSDVVWEEYAACRTSAGFGGPQQNARYVDALTSVLDGARERANAAIREYRLHGDLHRLLESAGQHICLPLRMYAYLQGHVDGLDTSLDASAQDAIDRSPYAVFFQRAAALLRALWERRGRWVSLSEFDPLRQLACDVLSDGGLLFKRLPDGRVWVDVPFRPGTY
jgi:hypothetical protein